MSDTEVTPVSPEPAPRQYRGVRGKEHQTIGYLLRCMETIAATPSPMYQADAQGWAQFHLNSLVELGWTEVRDAE